MFLAVQASMPESLSLQGVPFFAWGCFRYFTFEPWENPKRAEKSAK
jgi:hypothetical protein